MSDSCRADGVRTQGSGAIARALGLCCSAVRGGRRFQSFERAHRFINDQVLPFGFDFWNVKIRVDAMAATAIASQRSFWVGSTSRRFLWA